MELTSNGVTIQVDESTVMKMIVKRLSDESIPSTLIPIPVRIGEVWTGEGGIYAGIMRGREGSPDYHLIVGPEIDESIWNNADDDIWRSAQTKADELCQDGHKDFTLPFRAEQALLFANVPELFKKEHYWSREQHAEHADYAWCQHFGNVIQDYGYKSNNIRARAVRRLIIQLGDQNV